MAASAAQSSATVKSFQVACVELRADLARVQSAAARSSASWSLERRDLSKQVSDLGAAVAAARLFSLGVSSDVPVAVQHRLDSTIGAIEGL